MSGERAGLYIHVPFCLTRCGYCDFNTYAGLDHLRAPYLEGVTRESGLVAGQWRDAEFVSIFLGGGTPTMLASDQIVCLLGRLRERFRITPDAEITSEANPDTVDGRSLSALPLGGVTRLSIGAQSFDPAVLVALERIHQPDAVRSAFRAARDAGFDNVNLDLIYGGDGEALASWRRTLEETIALGPDHVSAYALTIEPATTLGRKVAGGLVPPPDPDLQADMYDLACRLLRAADYEHYEVSNWAKPGGRCTHNLGYWEGRPYLGLGAGAHSYRHGRRWWNVRPPLQYLERVSSGALPIGGEETLTADERRMERLLLGLRTTAGISVAEASRDPIDLVREGLLHSHDGRLMATDMGMFLANDLVIEVAGPSTEVMETRVIR
jgi:putative oxygen-independent coproporphyrinogen III oxidase